MARAAGFQIGKRFYPWPSRFRLGDPVLIEELTGLEYDTFLERLPDDDTPDDELMDPIVTLGLIGVAVWQESPTWRRDRVVRYVQALDRDAVEMVAPEVDEPQPGDADYVEPAPAAPGDGDPPAVTEAASPPASDTPATASGTGSASPSGPSSPETSGPPASDTGSQD